MPFRVGVMPRLRFFRGWAGLGRGEDCSVRVRGWFSRCGIRERKLTVVMGADGRPTTAAVAALVRASSSPASSVKDIHTLMALPSSVSILVSG